ncbi:MAG: phage tail tape measure protein, partial [Oscillospiraceae bacterium]
MPVDGSLIFDTGLDNNGFAKNLGTLTTAATAAAATITTAFTAASAAAVNVGMNFESSMSQVAATMGITSAAEEFEILSQAAKDMGETTKFSASQAGEALNYLALAGYDAEKSVAALPTVLNVAAAGGMELASASDMITDAMSALGLETSQMATFADQLAVTAQKSNTSVSQLGEAILTVGGTAKSLSGGVVEMNTALGILADNGIKGAEGGTALRNVILSLSAPTSTAAETLDRLGVTAFDASGSMRPLEDTFADLNTALSKLSDQDKNAVLNDIFNKVDLKSVNALLGTSAERFDQLSGYIADCEGAAADMAKTMDDNLKGDLTIMQSALEGAGIAAYEKFQVPMRTAVQEVTASIGDLTKSLTDGELSDSMDKVASAFSDIASNALKILANDVLPAVVQGFALIVDHGSEIISVAAGIGAAFVAWKVVPIVTAIVASFQTANMQLALLAAESGTAAVAQTALAGGLSLTEIAAGLFTGKITLSTAATAAFNAVCSVNPIVLIATALAAATVALVTYANTCDSTHNKIKEVNKAIEDAAQNTKDSISASEGEIAVVKDKMQKYEELRKQYEETGKGEEQLKALAEELQQYMPEGTQLIDEQTGAYNSLADSIDSVTEAMRRKATINAYEDEYTELIKQQLAAEKALEDASAKLSETSKWGLAGEVYNAKDYNDALKAVED